VTPEATATLGLQRRPALSVVIPNYRRPELLHRCLTSVEAARATCEAKVEVIVVDDGSRDGSCRLVRREFPEVKLIALDPNRGYPGAVNAGIAASTGDWILTLNNDTTVAPQVFDRLLEVALCDPLLGLAAAQQRFSSDPQRIYSAGTVLDGRAHATDRLMGAPASASERRPVDVFGACGAAALYRRSMLEQIGGFDEMFEFGLEDVDVAWRARMRGWRCLYVPEAIVYHDLGGTVPHGSRRRLYQAGRNRWLLIAKNLDGRRLRRLLPAMLVFDLAYLAYACPRFRTLAPLRGRVAALRLWRVARRTGSAGRAPVALPSPEPLRTAIRRALSRERAWRHAGRADAEGGLLFVNQYAPPDTASTGSIAFEVARAVAASGERVTFIAAQPSYHSGQPRAPRRELRGGVEVIRLPLLGGGSRKRRTTRFLGYGSFLLGAALTGRQLLSTRGARTVVCFHNPPLAPLVGAMLAGRGRRLVSVVFDIHPDVVLASGWISLPAAIVAVWDAVNVFALERADRVVVLSEGMRDVLVGKGVKRARIEVIPVWAQPQLEPTEADVRVRSRIGVGEGELLVLFAGNFGVTQQLEPVRQAITMLADSPVRFCFVGDGVHSEQWRERLSDKRSVLFLPFQSEFRYQELVAAADAGLVTLASGLERLVVPSRAYPLLSAGLPLLAVMGPGSELGELVDKVGAGVRTTDPACLADTLRRWLDDPAELAAVSRRARAAYQNTRDRTELKRRYVGLVRGVATALAVFLLFVPGVALAASAPTGVHVDPGSPAGKEYAIPLAQARATGTGQGGSSTQAAEALFGAGITRASGPRTSGANRQAALQPSAPAGTRPLPSSAESQSASAEVSGQTDNLRAASIRALGSAGASGLVWMGLIAAGVVAVGALLGLALRQRGRRGTPWVD
jgi:GT2 family glycosyltransferase/glycosyltransferase involved in cell wall biosynthesis